MEYTDNTTSGMKTQSLRSKCHARLRHVVWATVWFSAGSSAALVALALPGWVRWATEIFSFTVCVVGIAALVVLWRRDLRADWQQIWPELGEEETSR